MPDYQIGSTRLWGHSSRQEFIDDIKSVTGAEQRAQSRTLKPLRFTGAPNAAISATAAYMIPYVPQQGYIWNVRLFAGQVNTATSLRLGLGDPGSTTVPVTSILTTTSTTLPQGTLSSGVFFLNPGEALGVYASGSVTLEFYMLCVIETAAERFRDLII